MKKYYEVGKRYGRDAELRRKRLYKASDVRGEFRRELRRAGFRVRTMRKNGQHRLPKARVAFIAREPKARKLKQNRAS